MRHLPRFHGVTPSQVRRGGHTLKAFAPLRLKFILEGGYVMDYRIEKETGLEVLLKIEEDRVTYFSETDLNENQMRMISYQTPVDQNSDDDLGIYYVPIVEA